MFDEGAVDTGAGGSLDSLVADGVRSPRTGDAGPGAGATGGLSNEDLVARFSELAGHLNSGNARFILMLGEIDARRIWSDHGARTCGEWLSWRVGISGPAAREQLRVARALKDLPVTTREFVAGRISYSKVRAMTRVATPETESDLVQWATHTTAADIERFCRTYRKVVGQAELDDANERHRKRHISWYFDDDGSLVVVGRLSPEEGAVVVKALETGRDLVRRSSAQVESDDGVGRDADVSAETLDADAEAPEDDATGADRASQIPDDNVSAETIASDEPTGGTGPVSNADALVAMAHNLLANPHGRRRRARSPRSSCI